MMSADQERHARIKELFLAACEKVGRDRDAFLDEACGSDQAMRQEVESLLRYHRTTTILGEGWSSDLEQSAREAAGSSGSGRASDSESEEAGGAWLRGDQSMSWQFEAGTLVAGRYRIIGPLGRGGMGEIYKADDLNLNQTVALKFLPRHLTGNVRWLERFRAEVRLSRQVTHPNVCRVYDLVEDQSVCFISMEYIDGEDLSVLLRRIGRLPADKAVELARQLCAGLAAAHDRGVLHRDLKPANIMVDGRGHVRITDFGIAALSGDMEANQRGMRAGTPAYMSPEQAAGRELSVRSDLYSLGLVLYEIVTGRSAYPERSPEEGLPASRRTPPAAPSTIVSDVPSAMERMILRCLSFDPQQRPESAYAVAAKLPGSDPLADVLAAGMTPSPELVAASSTGKSLSMVQAGALVAVGLLLAVFLFLSSNRVYLLPQAGVEEPPAAMVFQARRIISELGFREPVSEQRWGYVVDREMLDELSPRPQEEGGWSFLSEGSPPAVYFWFRQSRRPMTQKPAFIPTTFASPPMDRSGMIRMRLTGRGELVYFEAVPSSGLSLGDGSAASPDWAQVFDLASLELGLFQSVEPTHRPPLHVDAMYAWEGVYPSAPELELRVEAATWGGRVVYFALISPWEARRQLTDDPPPPTQQPATALAGLVVFFLILIGSVILAFSNVRNGRGDRRGATIISWVFFLLGFSSWLLTLRYGVQVRDQAEGVLFALALSLFPAAITWVFYVALEPYVRRLRPSMLVTWSRLLTRRWRDPLVGRDILAGMAVGLGVLSLIHLEFLLAAWLGLPLPAPQMPPGRWEIEYEALLGVRHAFGLGIVSVAQGMWFAMVHLMLMLLLRLVLQNHWLTLGAYVLIGGLILAAGQGPDAVWPVTVCLIIMTASALVLVKLGLFALMVSAVTVMMVLNLPITVTLGAWYGYVTVSLMVVLAGAMALGFVLAVGGRRLWGDPWFDESLSRG